MFQMKEQNKKLEELSEVEMGNLPSKEKEFKVIITNILKEIKRILNEQSKKLDIFRKS